MSRDELQNKIKNMLEWANSYSPDAITEIIKRKSEILDEFDRLNEEIERLRWHYIDDGEFPEIPPGEFMEILIEYTTGVLEVDSLYCSNNKNIFFERVKRWRYIDGY